jgi:hypothetical protein
MTTGLTTGLSTEQIEQLLTISTRNWPRYLLPDLARQLLAALERLQESESALASASDWGAQLKGDLERAEEREGRLLELLREFHEAMLTEAGCHYQESDLGERTLAELQPNEYSSNPCNGPA